MKEEVSIFWFRRDRRIDDNAGLYRALKGEYPVVPIFIFDRNILDELEEKTDSRLIFIREALEKIQKDLLKAGATLDVRYGFPEKIWKDLLEDYNVKAVYTNTDYEPYATERDKAVQDLLKKKDISFHSYKDQVIFEKDEVVKDNGEPYSVYTPYARKWKAALKPFYFKSYPTRKYAKKFLKRAAKSIPSLSSMGFKDANVSFPSAKWEKGLIKDYKKTRDFPGIEGTSRLSVHLRFGTISIRELARETADWSETFLGELIWRDFYQMILWQHPQIVTESFHKEYDRIKWRNDEKEFDAWCKGETGYPIVDAGMRQLNNSGFMHNRVRMIVASFLTKHLLIDWRWGEAYFGKKLLDYDLASNNGGWQWAAGSGCDAAPYFRIFNPYTQTKKFDPDLKYVRHWVPELEEMNYPDPIIEHSEARERCLKVYQAALKK